MTEPKVLVDTNVVSYSMRGGVLAEKYAPILQDKLLAISFITVGELYYGAEKGNWGETRRRKLETQLKNYVVIPYDYRIAMYYGRIKAEGEKKGRSIGLHDAWIAACALRHGVPLVTHNAKHFQGISDLIVITNSLET